MKLVVKVPLIAIAVLLALLLVFYLSLPFWVKSEIIEKGVIQSIEGTAEGAFEFEEQTIRYFPRPSVTFTNASLESNWDVKGTIKTERLEIGFQLLDLIFARGRVGFMNIKNGDFFIEVLPEVFEKPFRAENVQLELRRGIIKNDLRISFEGSHAGVEKAFSGKVFMESDSFRNWNWGSISINGDVALEETDLKQFVDQVGLQFPVTVESGRLSAGVSIVKEKGTNDIAFEAAVRLPEFGYRLSNGESESKSPIVDLAFDFDVVWKPKHEAIEVRKIRVNSPLGNIESHGLYFLGSREIRDFRISATGLGLDEVPRYWVGLEDILPLNLGFSGMSDLDISLQGTMDHLTIHANMDLTQSLLSYAKYFSKAKETPLQLNMELLLKEGKTLGGDFSVFLKEVRMKGALSEVELKTGEGQLNFITNKFSIADLKDTLLPLQNYEVEGDVKFFANWKGQLFPWGETDSDFNVTFEKGSLGREGGTQVEDIDLTVDMSETSFVIKKGKFRIEDSPVDLGISIYNLRKKPSMKAKIKSDHLVPFRVAEVLHDLTLEWLPPEINSIFENIRTFTWTYFPDGRFVDDLDTEFGFQNDLWDIKKLKMKMYGGDLSVDGKVNRHPEEASYDVTLEINQLVLKDYLGERKEGKHPMDGKLFLKIRLYGDHFDYLNLMNPTRGEGNFLMTEGAIHSVDLMKSIGNISELSSLGETATGQTDFHDLRCEFLIREGEFRVAKLMMVSDELDAQAEGEMSPEGFLNFRMNAFLSEGLTAEYILPRLGRKVEEGSRFGPIPLLISGKIDDLEVQPDPELMPDLLENLRKKRAQRVLREDLPEDFFLEREAIS